MEEFGIARTKNVIQSRCRRWRPATVTIAPLALDLAPEIQTLSTRTKTDPFFRRDSRTSFAMEKSVDDNECPDPQCSVFCAIGSETTSISEEELRNVIGSFLDAVGCRQDVLLLPPDFTRFHSEAGAITQMICNHYGYTGNKVTECTTPNLTILPALGTHSPMTKEEIRIMYGQELAEKSPSPFRVHDWRNDVVTIGEAPASMVSEATNGLIEKPWPAQLNRLVWQKRKSIPVHDPLRQKDPSLILSIGQVVPHEVMGMANYNKNLFVGTGGVEAINLSHFIGAVYGMEKMMGRADNPLRSILHWSSKEFLEKELDLWYILTVIGRDDEKGNTVIRGLFIGNDIQCYQKACELSLKVNFTLVEKPLHRVVAYLNPEEFHSTWLGNKSIYRTRMAMADGGELIVLAPGLERFGEDEAVDQLIRKYGYVGTPAIMALMREHKELQDNLSAVAHLIHGSTEGRFKVTYCPGKLSKEEIESVGFQYGDLEKLKRKYDLDLMTDGWNSDDDGPFYFIRNPALGLWAEKSRFDASRG